MHRATPVPARGIGGSHRGGLSLHRALSAAVSRGADHLRDHAEDGTELDRFRALVSLDPTNEVPAQHLMSLLAERGQPGVALRVFQDLRSRLLADEGRVADPETEDRAGEIAREAAGRRDRSAPRRVAPFPTPLVGRSAEVAAVEALVARGFRFVTVTGMGGIDKSRAGLQVDWAR